MSRSKVGKGADGAGDAPGRDYEVGYGRPPVATRFRPGGVGNPKGRPKKRKSISQSIEEALMTRVTIEGNGRAKVVTALEVIIQNLVSAAARHDTRAIHALFTLRDRYQDSAETTVDLAELAAEDRKIIEEHLEKLMEEAAASGSKTSMDGPNDAGPNEKVGPSTTSGKSDGSNDEGP